MARIVALFVNLRLVGSRVGVIQQPYVERVIRVAAKQSRAYLPETDCHLSELHKLCEEVRESGQ